MAVNDRDVAFDPTVATPGSSLGGAARSGMRNRHQDLAEEFIGQVIGGRYQLKRIVGAGGFGAVFEGEDQRIKKRVAVKLLFADMLRDREAVTRFKLEAEAASQVGHRNIIDITDFDFTEDGVAYMVMEFLEGEDLAHIIRGGDAPGLARVVQICLQACRGLGAAHRKGIVHRDLKPGNIFVTRTGGEPDQVKVVDFGISRASELDEEERLTKTGQILGTPYYMAPEQADGIREVDARADIYAMGVILFEGCSGKLPFIARTPIGLITKHASEPPADPRTLNPGIPQILANTILKCLEKDPADRFESAAELEQALLCCLATLDPTRAAIEQAAGSGSLPGQGRALSEEALVALTTPASVLRASVLRQTMATQPVSKRRPFLLVAVGLGALVVGILVTLYLLKDPKAPSPTGTPAAALGTPGETSRITDPSMEHGTPPPRDPDAGGSVPGLRDPRATAAPGPDAATPPPQAPRMVTIQCRIQPADVRVTDRDDTKTYGICPGALRLPEGLKPIRLYFRKTGFIARSEEVLPNQHRELTVLPLTAITTRRPPMGGRLPDDPIQ